jgi:threonylcarbamoyladenosine tRNA methylthiotransferase MtaB
MAVKHTIAFKTLGCRLNQYETDALVSEFRKQGYTVVPFHEEAEMYIINTCTVTNQSDHKSRNMISQAIRRREGATVIVTGCMANHFREQLEQQEGVTYVVENDRKSSIVSLAEAHFHGEMVSPALFPADKFHFPLTDHSFHTRSLIKIQDGCDNFCSYCIIPRVRGRAVSRPAGEILDNIRQVTDAGFREVVLTGVNITRYRHEQMNFEDLVEKILALPGDFRLRISSIEPEGFGEKLYNLFAHPKLTPHLHLCLQSGSDTVLKRMRRKYTVSVFMEMAESIRKRYPDFNFTTDIIVGFPGETDEEFAASVQVAREARFSHIHTFKFSKRDGTPAARMADQVPEKVKTERSRIIREVSLQNRLAYFRSMLGRRQDVLFEKRGRAYSLGYGEHYLPVAVDAPVVPNTMAGVRLTGIEEGSKDPFLRGKLL